MTQWLGDVNLNSYSPGFRIPSQVIYFFIAIRFVYYRHESSLIGIGGVRARPVPILYNVVNI